MKRTFLVAAAIVTFAASAYGADMPGHAPVYKADPAPTFNWTGGYVGVQGGVAWFDGRLDNTAGGPITRGPSYSDTSGTFGATLGYNWQNGLWVIGLEGDWSWTDIKITNSTTPSCAPATCTIQSDWFATARARIGYTVTPNTLLYATGGAAFTHLTDKISLGFQSSDTKTSWTAGGGIESMLTQNWSVKAEYLYIDVPNGPDLFTGVLTVENPRNQSLQIVRAGLNYKF